MQTERRCVQRKTSRGISYVEFEAGSGGIVLDASENGLGFRTAHDGQQLGPSRIWIWISPRPEERIEITGNVVWTDISNRTGGLRFIETDADSCNQIRKWLWQPGELEVSSQFSRHLTVASRPQNEVDEARPVGLRPISGFLSLFTSKLPGQSQDSQASEGRIAYGIAAGFLIGALVVAVVVLVDMFRPEVGSALIHVGEKIAGVGPQRLTSSALPSSAPVPAHASASTEANVRAVWYKCGNDGHWCSLVDLDLDSIKDVGGVYIIWLEGDPGRVVCVGQGNFKERFSKHRSDSEILVYRAYGKLRVTWASVPSSQRDGVERYLVETWRPLVGDAFPDALPIAVNSPWL